MSEPDLKEVLRLYLQRARDAMLWKLDGLGEYDVRRPLTPTATNLLGLVKHLAGVELGYFGETFGRPAEVALPWSEDDPDPHVDMYAKAGESRDMITGLYRQAWAHSDATIDALALDDQGRVAWWPADRNPVTLGQIMVHVTAETARHAGQADIVRELIDGVAGLSRGNSNLPEDDDWASYRDRVEIAAKAAAGSDIAR
jgi:hypothetical protein